jgi:large subunit ribosomal protein L21
VDTEGFVHLVFEFQGRQYRVEAGEKIQVPHLDAEPGAKLSLERVLLIEGEDGVRVGRPLVDGARVEATVIQHGRGKKILVGKFKKRKNYRRRNRYRDDFTEVESSRSATSKAGQGTHKKVSVPAAARQQFPPRCQAFGRSSSPPVRSSIKGYPLRPRRNVGRGG